MEQRGRKGLPRARGAMVASGAAGHPRPTSRYSSLISSWLPLARHLLSKPQFPLLEKDSQCEHLTLQVSEGHLVGTHPQNISGGSLSKCSSNFSLQGASFGLCDELHSRDSLTISQVRKPLPWKARSLLRSQNRETQAPGGSEKPPWSHIPQLPSRLLGPAWRC